MKKTRKSKAPPWLRKKSGEILAPKILDESARIAIGQTLYRNAIDEQKSVLDEIDSWLQLYGEAGVRKQDYPKADQQKDSIKGIETAISSLRRLDLETKKRVYLSIGRSNKRSNPLRQFRRGKRRFERWLSQIEGAAQHAKNRSLKPKKGPDTHEALIWLVHELAEIWERESNTKFGSSGNRVLNTVNVRSQERARKFVETVLRAGNVTWDDASLTYVMKAVVKARHKEREISDESEVSDETYGRE